MLFHVYKENVPEGYYLNEPFGLYKAILDADWVMYLLPPLLLLVVVVGLLYAWKLHEIPSHKAHQKHMRQAELVAALTLLGLFEHWVWAVALFIAFTDWDHIEDSFTRVLRNARTPVAAPDVEVVIATQIDPVVVPPPAAPVSEGGPAKEGDAA